jgi:hypothetical protein
MTRGFLVVVMACCALVALGAPDALGDAAYHSGHVALRPAGAAPLRSGFVENIHPNGPQYFAHERYVLNGAIPDASLQATLHIYGTSDCTGGFFPFPTVVVHTNREGNGEANEDLPLSVVPPQNHNLTLWITWNLGDSNAPTYVSDCTPVTND